MKKNLLIIISLISGNLVGMQHEVITPLLSRINEIEIERSPSVIVDQIEKINYKASYLPQANPNRLVTYMIFSERNIVNNNYNFCAWILGKWINSNEIDHSSN